MEVTRCTNGAYRRLHRRILGRDGTASVPRTHATADWLVWPSPLADMRKVRARIDRHLATVEAEGRLQFAVSTDVDASPAVMAMWHDLRVTDGLALDPPHEGVIRFGFPSDHALLGEDQILEAVTQEANKDDNRNKLQWRTAKEAHLFVYIDFYGYPADAAMRAGLLPQRYPTVPDQVTDIWVTRAVGNGTCHMLWHATRESGWVDLGLFATKDIDAV